jgi:hypothetical protein
MVADREGGEYQGGVTVRSFRTVMRGLDPRIHPASQESSEEDGLPGQARQ